MKKPSYGLSTPPVAAAKAAPAHPAAKAAPVAAPIERGHVTHNEANRVPDSARHVKGSRAKMNRGKFY